MDIGALLGSFGPLSLPVLAGEQFRCSFSDHYARRHRVGRQPQSVNSRCVSGCVHGEHLSATCPDRTSGAGAFLAPVEGRAGGLCRPHLVERGDERGGHVLGPGAGDADRQPRCPSAPDVPGPVRIFCTAIKNLDARRGAPRTAPSTEPMCPRSPSVSSHLDWKACPGVNHHGGACDIAAFV